MDNDIFSNEKNSKYSDLISFIKKKEKVAIAFSGGVDSTFLLYAAKEALGKNNVLAVTINSEAFTLGEHQEAMDYCKSLDIKQVSLNINILDNKNIPELKKNPKNRCYLCKRELFKEIIKVAESEGITTVFEGSNKDDEGDYRPGFMAIKELNVISPLRECGIYKEEIRKWSHDFDLPTWNKPSKACLMSRFAYGENISIEKLNMVDRAEHFLAQMDFKQYRVRIHGNDRNYIARIEVLPNDLEKIIESNIREKINTEFKSIGFSYVTLDLLGFRSGSMNEVL